MRWRLFNNSGRPFVRLGAQKAYSPEILLQIIITSFDEQFFRVSGPFLRKEIVISVPSYFNPDQRRGLASAAFLAGHSSVRIFNESEIIFSGLEMKQQRILVAAFGASGLELSLSPPSSSWIPPFSRDSQPSSLWVPEFSSDLIFNSLMSVVLNRLNQNLPGHLPAYYTRCLYSDKSAYDFEILKKTLSSLDEVEFAPDSCAGLFFVTTVGRNALEAALGGQLNETATKVQKYIQGFRVDQIVLFGDGMKLPALQRLFRRFGSATVANRSSVALSAAFNSSVLKKDAFVYQPDEEHVHTFEVASWIPLLIAIGGLLAAVAIVAPVIIICNGDYQDFRLRQLTSIGDEGPADNVSAREEALSGVGHIDEVPTFLMSSEPDGGIQRLLQPVQQESETAIVSRPAASPLAVGTERRDEFSHALTLLSTLAESANSNRVFQQVASEAMILMSKAAVEMQEKTQRDEEEKRAKKTAKVRWLRCSWTLIGCLGCFILSYFIRFNIYHLLWATIARSLRDLISGTFNAINGQISVMLPWYMSGSSEFISSSVFLGCAILGLLFMFPRVVIGVLILVGYTFTSKIGMCRSHYFLHGKSLLTRLRVPVPLLVGAIILSIMVVTVVYLLPQMNVIQEKYFHIVVLIVVACAGGFALSEYAPLDAALLSDLNEL
jgi:hypothetical protein